MLPLISQTLWPSLEQTVTHTLTRNFEARARWATPAHPKRPRHTVWRIVSDELAWKCASRRASDAYMEMGRALVRLLWICVALSALVMAGRGAEL